MRRACPEECPGRIPGRFAELRFRAPVRRNREWKIRQSSGAKEFPLRDTPWPVAGCREEFPAPGDRSAKCRRPSTGIRNGKVPRLPFRWQRGQVPSGTPARLARRQAFGRGRLFREERAVGRFSGFRERCLARIGFPLACSIAGYRRLPGCGPRARRAGRRSAC